MKLTITQIGVPKEIQTSKGPAQKNYIKASECNDKFLNYFVNKTTQDWKVGQVVEVEDVEKQEYTSKKDGSLQTSYNIKLPRFGGNSDVMKALEEVRNQLAKVILGQKEIFEAIVNPPKSEYPDREKEIGLKPGEAHPFDDDAGLEHINADEFQGF